MPPPLEPRPAPADTIREIIRDLQRTGEISPQVALNGDLRPLTLDDLGVDSVGRIALQAAIEDRFSICLSADDFGPESTFVQLENLMIRWTER